MTRKERQHSIMDVGMDSTTEDLILVLILLLTHSLAWGKLSDCPPIQNSVLSSIK